MLIDGFGFGEGDLNEDELVKDIEMGGDKGRGVTYLFHIFTLFL